jgi:triosephosphate isomerase
MNVSSPEEAVDLAGKIATNLIENVDVVLCPPFPWLLPVREALADSKLALGAQNCWHLPNGAYTGEVSTSMLSGLCEYVIVGHSERRQALGDSEDIVREKVRAVLRAGMAPILCIGESLEVRQRGVAVEHVIGQLANALAEQPPDKVSRCVVAYEPIWAIGTGIAASSSDAETMALAIRESIDGIVPGLAQRVRILYGGSVTAANSAEFFAQPNVDGALVGGASLDPDAFSAIVRSAAV